ncbi:MAG: hypothetical protein GY782_08705 [Gammaproteobacteria bacterium]|nr:hypothetical protein [Gammaproteobacteria bacterium]
MRLSQPDGITGWSYWINEIDYEHPTKRSRPCAALLDAMDKINKKKYLYYAVVNELGFAVDQEIKEWKE